MSSSAMDLTNGNGFQKALWKKNGKRKQPFPSINKIPSHLAKKMKQDKLYKPPTADEMNQLKETETMYHSSLFRFQIDELLAEVKLKEKHKATLKSLLNSLKLYLKNLPSSDTYEIHDHSWIGKGIKVPIMQDPKNRKGLFHFLAPTEVHEIGSYVLETICAPEPIIDLAVKIPRACFQKQDFLNHLYHRKRALYLVYLAKSLTDSDLVEKVEFGCQNSCHLKPTLLLRPNGKLGKHFSIRLLPYPDLETFKLSRFSPTKNNVRCSWFFGTSNDEEDAVIPTPQYNSTVLADLLLPNLAEYAEAKISAQSLKDAIILLKVWSIQRELYGGSALSGFIINMLIAYLLLKKKINPLMSSYQVFRNALLVLKNENWLSQGAILCEDNVDNCPALQDFHTVFDVVFVDSSGFLNLCHSVSQASCLMLQHEAALALRILDGSSTESFFQLFIQKVPCCRKFEYLVHFAKPKKFIKYSSHLETQSSVLDNGGDHISAVTGKLCQLLKRGLGDRVHLVYAQMSSLASWDISKQPPNPNLKKHVTIGLLINQDYVSNNLEKGPLADDPAAIEFRNFWGNKSELRRFKDGSIHEAVLWPAETIHDKRLVLPQIVSYIFQRHASISPEEILCTGMELDTLLTLPKEIFPKDSASYGTGEEAALALMQSYNSLVKILRKLDGLSLAVTSIQGTSAAFRFTDVFPPCQRSYPNPMNLCFNMQDALALKNHYPKSPSWIPALHVVVHLEGSGKWPDDVEALTRIKAALHIEMSTLLKSQFKLTSKAYNSYVDVLMDGYVFRLSVATHKEIYLLKQNKTPEGMIRVEDNEKSRQLECSTEILPKLNGILHGLHQQYNTYGTACRLAKRWISSQLLYDYVNDVVVELLMAFIFISPEPFTCPNSPQIAFQRFLTLLHTHDWESDPLIVNLNNDLAGSEIAEIELNFRTQRADLPAMVVAIPLDKTGTLWTQHVPTALILKRLVKLSKTSIETLEKQLYISQVSDFKQIFRPPLTPYNVLIHLNKKFVPKRYCAVDMNEENKIKPFKTYYKMNAEKIPVTDFDPVMLYLNDLKEAYSEYALFFYDIYGGDYIAVLWKPNIFESKKFKVSDINGCMVTGSNSDGTKNCTFNLELILSGFSVIGGDLVKKVEMTEKSIC